MTTATQDKDTTEKVETIKTEIVEYSATAAAIAALRKKYGGVKFEVTTKTGLELAKASRKELRDLRVALEHKRTELKAPALERSRLIDDEAKRITAALVELEDPIAKQIKAEEDRVAAEKAEAEAKERARVDGLRNRITHFRTVAGTLVGKPSADVQITLTDVEANDIGDEFEEFKGEARDARTICITQLQTLLRERQESEAREAQIAKEREELKALREADETRKAAEKAEQERQEAVKKAAQEQIDRQHREKQEAERKALDEEISAKRAEQQRIDDEITARRKAEQDRIDEANRIEREKIEAERKRQADEADRQEHEKRVRAELEAAADQRQRAAAPIMADALVRLAVMDETTGAQLSIITTALKAAGITPKLKEPMQKAA